MPYSKDRDADGNPPPGWVARHVDAGKEWGGKTTKIRVKAGGRLWCKRWYEENEKNGAPSRPHRMGGEGGRIRRGGLPNFENRAQRNKL